MKSILTTLIALTALAAPAAAETPGPQERVRTVVRDVTPRPVLYQRGGQEHTDSVRRTLKIGASGELDLSNFAGPIVVTRGGGNEATIEIVKTARADTVEDAREMLKLVTVEIAERGSRVEVRARYPEQPRTQRRQMSVSVAYRVMAPADTRLTIRSLSGSIKVTDIRGELLLDTMSGDVDVSGAARIAAAKSVSGNVTIMATHTEAGLDASSISGNVTLRDVGARRLSLNSISGNVTLDGVTAERVDAQSMTGNIMFGGTLAPSGRYDLKSHSGDVRVRVDGGVGFEVDASTFSGSIRSELPLATQTGQPGRGNRQRSLRGTFGDGSAVVSITSFSGSVVIGKR